MCVFRKKRCEDNENGRIACFTYLIIVSSWQSIIGYLLFLLVIQIFSGKILLKIYKTQLHHQ